MYTTNFTNSGVDSAVTSVVDGILTAILQWRIAWLEEQKNNEQPPPICRSQLKKLKITYDNYKDYESTFVPLIMHEIWAQVFDEWNKLQAEMSGEPMDLDEVVNPLPGPSRPPWQIEPPHLSGQPLCPKQFWIGVVEHKSSGHWQCVIKCQFLVDSNKVAQHLKIVGDGDLVRLDLVLMNDAQSHNQVDANQMNMEPEKNESVLSLFGYVNDVSQERVGKYTSLAECFVSRLSNRSYHVINYNVLIAKRPLRLKQTDPMKMTGLYYLKPMIRQIESVAILRESALASDILSPKLITCQLSTPTVVSINSPHYNEMQYKAIIGANEALVRNIPKIQLIQGPPGTGKTHTLIGIIKHFFLNWQDTQKLPKMLICAPSNGAIDEIGKRLIKERGFLKNGPPKRSLRIVRVGNPDQFNESIRSIVLEELIETNAIFKADHMKKKHMTKIKELELELSKCDTEITNLRFLKRHREIPTIELKIAHLLKDLEASKASEEVNTKREASDASRRSIKYDLIKNADVILTTLNSCQRNPLDVLFRGDRSELTFHCVVVDEASQCCEPELLMPLCYKISKMILIGDPMQLPATVISRHAQEYNYGQSLFERFFIHFGKYNHMSPVAMLTEQYRMHPEICRFPSLHFYDNRLISATKVASIYPLRPYVMFDLRHGAESRSGRNTIENEAEASLVRNLLMVILTKAPKNSQVGVITPYKGQKRLITHKIRTLLSQRNISIDVNTCDGFQGQEKDIIVLSCVRAFDSGGSIGFLKSTQRINVALTRAKHSLIVCLSAKAVFRDKTWQALINDARARQVFEIFDQTPSIVNLTNLLINRPSFNEPVRDPLLFNGERDQLNDPSMYEPAIVYPMDID